MPLLSVEISTYNRKDTLRLALDKLAHQTCPFDRFEVVVSDDGSFDGTCEMIETLRAALPYEVRSVSNAHRGPGVTHNAGIRACRGDLVLMIADDIFADPHLVEEHLNFHARHPDSRVVVGGRLTQSPELSQTAFQRCWSAHLNTRFPIGEPETRLDYINFWVNNLSFKRAFMLNSGMFQDWPAAAHEDLELGYRLQQRSMILLFNPRALGYHHHPETVQSTAARAYMQGYHWHHFEAHVPDRWLRVRSENVRLTDGLGVYFRTLLKKVVRRVCLNRFTLSAFVMPLARLGEKVPLIYSVIPLLPRFITLYAFHRGLNDYRAERPFHLPLPRRIIGSPRRRPSPGLTIGLNPGSRSRRGPC